MSGPGRPDLDGLVPPEVATVCDAAVDPLEIAAALEAAGVSDRVAQTTFGRADLFALAEELYASRPRRPVPVTGQRPPPRHGDLRDLALGLLFVVPAVSLAVAARALHLVLPWWSFPAALTVGWAAGQAVARVATCLRNRGREPAPLVLPSLLATAGAGLVVGLAGVAVGGGGPSTVGTITLFCLYVASLSVLSVYDEALPMAASLAPALVCSVAFLLDPGSRTCRDAEVVAVGVTLLASLALALRHGRGAWLVRWGLSRYERRSVLTYLVYGACCGVAVSAASVVAPGGPRIGPLSLVALPVMLSLGVLEFQLHSFRARTTDALHVATSLAAFERRAVAGLARSVTVYAAALTVASAAVVTVAVASGDHLSLLSLGAEDVIGVTLFTGMVVSMCSALHVGVRSWLVGAAAFAGGLGVVHLAGLGGDLRAVQAATLAGTVAALAAMASGVLGVVRVPFHFQR